MEKSQIKYFVVVASVILFLLVLFLLFVLVWYRKKRNRHIIEKQIMRNTFENNLLKSKLETQEQTFNIISQEIHDNVGQLLSLAKVQLSIAEQNEITDKALLADIKNNIGNALNDLRDIARSLNSDRIQRLTLQQIVEEELQRINLSGVLVCSLQTSGIEKAIPEHKKAFLFRMIQECLQNTLKHADATQINADMHYTPKALEIIVSDNGKGFNLEKEMLKSTGLGLNNIKNRVHLIGGSVHIDSAEGKGTTVVLNIPYER